MHDIYIYIYYISNSQYQQQQQQQYPLQIIYYCYCFKLQLSPLPIHDIYITPAIVNINNIIIITSSFSYYPIISNNIFVCFVFFISSALHILHSQIFIISFYPLNFSLSMTLKIFLYITIIIVISS